jgi:P-type E1-E2 ATPase
VRRGGATLRVPLNQVRVGDAVLVAPGDCIAVDGSVRSGHSYVDQATITGESTPVEKGADAIVYAGTMNQSGALEIVVDRLGRDTSFGKIVEAVEHAERSRAPIQKTADRYAGYLVYFALACAALTFAITAPRCFRGWPLRLGGASTRVRGHRHSMGERRLSA